MRFRLVCCLACLSLVACQVYTNSLLERSHDSGVETASGGQTSTGGTAGIDGGGAGTGGDASGCNPIHPPPRPSQPTPGADAGTGDIVFALKDIVLDQSGDQWRSIGYDLDGLCSVGANPQVECTAPSGGPAETDGVRGTDNAFGHDVFPLVKTTDPTIQSSARSNEDAGQGDIILHISGWNGADDDPSVNVWLAQSVYAIPQGATAPAPLNWDGTDSFYVIKSAFSDGTLATPLINNDNAYVTGRMLVFRLPERSPIYFSASKGNFVIKLTDATLTGQISADSTRMDSVIISGRWSLMDIAANFNQIGICPGTIQRNLADNLMNGTADVRSTPGTGGPGAICDAISVGVGFTGYRGLVGGTVDAPNVPPVCTVDAGSGDAGF